MLSRLQAASPMANKFRPRNLNHLIKNRDCQSTHYVIPKRWSGHNKMAILPSTYDWKSLKNWVHFYALLGAIPTAVALTIINIRANPELTEIPEGYEPRHWEYYKHPIARFAARYFYVPNELEHECLLSRFEKDSETKIMREIQQKVFKLMAFYNDHRSHYFRPFFAEYWRTQRDTTLYLQGAITTDEGHYYDIAYDPDKNPVPTEGYRPTDL